MMDDDHLIQFRDDGWTIQHPISERELGLLFSCSVRWIYDDPGVRGIFKLNKDATLGEEVEESG